MTRPTATLIFVVVTAVAVAAVATATSGRKRRGLEVEAGGLAEYAINGVLSSGGCDDSDFEILHNFYVMCMSYGLYSRPSCLVPAANQSSINVGRTWPQQAYSTVKLLDTIASVGNASACLSTPTARAVISSLNGPMVTDGGGIMETWTGFQMGYYAMPRPAGDRLETPWTLGLKSFGFAYLAYDWAPAKLEAAVSSAGQTISNLTAAYTAAIAPSFAVCEEVCANCFINSTYTPSRNGTCVLSVEEFKAGFELVNIKLGAFIPFPFYV